MDHERETHRLEADTALQASRYRLSSLEADADILREALAQSNAEARRCGGGLPRASDKTAKKRWGVLQLFNKNTFLLQGVDPLETESVFSPIAVQAAFLTSTFFVQSLRGKP